jgi:hypothetical protein
MENIASQHDKQKVTEKIKQISNKGGEIAETIAQKLQREGRLKGLEEGLEKGIKQVAISMIHDNVDYSIIMKYTNLSYQQIELLKELSEIEKTYQID